MEHRLQKYLRTKTQFLTIVVAYLLVTFSFNPFVLYHTIDGGDDASYISHAFTIALDFDLDYSNELLSGPEGKLAPSGHAPRHAIGAGIMAAPFVAAFSVLDRIEHNPVIADHRQHAGSWSLFGYFIAAAAWFLAGVWLYIKALAKAGAKIRARDVVLLTWAVGIPYYVLARPTMCHAFEFAAIAIVFWSAVQIAFETGTRRIVAESLLVLGLLLTGLTRMADINIVMLPLAIWGLLAMFGRCPWPRFSISPDMVTLAISGAVAALIFVSLSIALYDVPIPTYLHTYGPPSPFPSGVRANVEYFLAHLYLVWPILTSTELGLVYTAPLFVAGVIALGWHIWAGWRDHPYSAVITLITSILLIAIPLSVVLVWREPGSSYGYRYLFTLTPLCLMAAVFFIDRAPQNIGNAFRIVLLAASAWACIGVAFFDTSPDMMLRGGFSVLGGQPGATFPDYEKKVVMSFASPKALVNLAAHRFPGFAAAVALKSSATLRDRIASGRFASGAHYLNDIAKSSNGYVAAFILFWLLYPLCLVWLCKCPARGSADTPEIPPS